MGCVKCKKIVSRCDCCFLVDGDTTFKLVTYCEECNAYICNDCEGNNIKRGKAYVTRKIEGLKEYFSNKTK